MSRLTAAFVKAARHSGRRNADRHHDGNGLFLQVMPGGSKQWVQRLALNGAKLPSGDRRRSDYGVGTYPAMGLAEARLTAAKNALEAREYRKAVARGGTPALPVFEANRQVTLARKAGRAVPAAAAAVIGLTFAQAFEACILERSKQWKNPATDLRSWRADLRLHLQDLAPLPVAAVTVDHLRACMDRLNPVTRDKVLRRCATVFAFAEAGELLRNGNPARKLRASWAGLKRPEPKHRKALPWREVPAFYARLTAGGTGADARGALALLLLCGSRSGEARGARWEEISPLDDALWTIPAARMKDGREHRVPLAAQAVEVLRAAGPKRSGLVFRAPRGGPVSDKALRAILAEMGVEGSVHGFRTTISVWGLEQGGFSGELLDRHIAHQVGSAVSRAYQRSDRLEDRRRVAEAYGAFVAGGAR